MAEQQELWGVGAESWLAAEEWGEGEQSPAGRQQLQLQTPKGSGGATTLVRYSYVRVSSDIQKAFEWEFCIPRHLCNFQPWGDSTEIKGKVEVMFKDRLDIWWL